MNLRVHDVREKVVIIHFATQLPGNSSPFLLKVEFRYGSTWPPTDGFAFPQDGFSYFSIGNDYTCNGLSCFLVVKTPFENGLNLEWAKEKLDKELERLKLESIGNFGLVGGLRVS